MAHSMARPSEAVLPPRERPQGTNLGGRPRISHISRLPRVHPDTIPKGLPDRTGNAVEQGTKSDSGCSYRNAAFQALLNVPMFINFLRLHSNRGCNIRSCLACGMRELASYYWMKELDSSHRATLDERLDDLWKKCLSTFWGKDASKKRKIGPDAPDAEFYTESFLLNFLSEMSQQLEAKPSEYQTFQQLFTTHVARRWKCTSGHCGYVSQPHRWESALHLPIDVQKPHARNTQTKVFNGLVRGIQRWTTNRLGCPFEHHDTKKCEKCGQETIPYNDIINAPEVLVLVRNTHELDRLDTPDVPYAEKLKLQPLTSNRSLSHIEPYLVSYTLVSGTAEKVRSSSNRSSHAVSFAWSPSTQFWYGIDDLEVWEIGEISQLDRLQRPSEDLNNPITNPVFPEVFIYIRTDNSNVSDIGQFGSNALAPVTPAIPSGPGMARNMISRTITTLFTQRIGKGLLKFKIDMYPAEPRPDEVIDCNMRVAYELDNKHWSAVFSASQLQPLALGQAAPDFTMETPLQFKPIARAKLREMGQSPTEARRAAPLIRGRIGIHAPATGNSHTINAFSRPTILELPTDAGTIARNSNFNSDAAVPFASSNPFASTNILPIHNAVNGLEMDLDTIPLYSFTDSERVKQWKRDAEARQRRDALRATHHLYDANASYGGRRSSDRQKQKRNPRDHNHGDGKRGKNPNEDVVATLIKAAEAMQHGAARGKRSRRRGRV